MRRAHVQYALIEMPRRHLDTQSEIGAYPTTGGLMLKP